MVLKHKCAGQMYEISYNENYQKCTFYANSYTEDLIFYLQFQCINAYNKMKQKPSSDGSSVDIQLHVPNIRILKQWKSDFKTSVVLSFKYQLTIYIFIKGNGTETHVGNPEDIQLYVSFQMYAKSYNEYLINKNSRSNHKMPRFII